jgi:hypothetical protein
MKKKKFIVYYHVDGVYEARVTAESLEAALQQAKQMSKVQLDATPGDVLDETIRITGVFE